MSRGRRRPRPTDSPGTDVAERHDAVHVMVIISYQRPNPHERHRGDKMYQREDVWLHRNYRFNFGPEFLVAGGDVQLSREAFTRLVGRLRWEGWPDRMRTSDLEGRPGA